MLNRLDNIGRVLGATDNFRRKFHAFLSHLIDLVHHIFDRWAVDDDAIRALAERAKHGGDTEANHKPNKGGEPGYLEEGP